MEVGAAAKALEDFKAWLRSTYVVETFTTPEDLGWKIAILFSRVAAKRAGAFEVRVVHPLQHAPHFSGREELLDKLLAWIDDTASRNRVYALIAAGGTGKTAITERIVDRLQRRPPLQGQGGVLVWSFNASTHVDDFLGECCRLFLGEDEEAPPGGRFERLPRGLGNDLPHLLVLDGLERVQTEGGRRRARGELEDGSLLGLLQKIAEGKLGRTRALVTSRFPLVELHDRLGNGLGEARLEDLPPDTARAVLRAWNVKGDDAALDSVAAQVGCHALSVAVIGSYLKSFEDGRIEAAASFHLEDAVVDSEKAARLARMLDFYSERLSPEERALLTRLSVFPRGITPETIEALIEIGGTVAGALVNAARLLRRLPGRLVELGPAFKYADRGGADAWTAHPFVREHFARLLDCPAEGVFDAVARHLGQSLDWLPAQHPVDAATLDRYERLIEATQLAGRSQEAMLLYQRALGGFENLGTRLGDYRRGYRVLRALLPADVLYHRAATCAPAPRGDVWGRGRAPPIGG